MAVKRDFYEVLGLSSSASPDEIKSAYRRLARQHHPDVNQGDGSAEARFKEINEAYEVLSNPEKRQRYDQFGHAGINGAPGAGGFDFGGFGGLLNSTSGAPSRANAAAAVDSIDGTQNLLMTERRHSPSSTPKVSAMIREGRCNRQRRLTRWASADYNDNSERTPHGGTIG